MVKDKLRKLPCSGTVRFKLNQLLDSLEFNEKQVLKTITEIRRFCRNDPELSQCIEYLMSLPGIGWITASQLLARIGDWRESCKNISSTGWVSGIECPPSTPPERELIGDSSPALGMNGLEANSSRRRGRRSDRTASCGSFSARFAANTRARSLPEIAIVAVACKLTARISVVLMKQRSYEVREKVHSAPLTQEETLPQGATRPLTEPGEKNSLRFYP